MRVMSPHVPRISIEGSILKDHANPVIFPADVSPGSISRDNNPFNSSPDARRPRVGLAMRNARAALRVSVVGCTRVRARVHPRRGSPRARVCARVYACQCADYIKERSSVRPIYSTPASLY